MPAVNDVGEPCAGESHARFDGRALETEPPPARHPRSLGRCAEKRHHPKAWAGTISPDPRPPRQRSTLLGRLRPSAALARRFGNWLRTNPKYAPPSPPHGPSPGCTPKAAPRAWGPRARYGRRANSRAFPRCAAPNPVVYAELPSAQHVFDLFHSIRFDTLINAVEAFTARAASHNHPTQAEVVRGIPPAESARWLWALAPPLNDVARHRVRRASAITRRADEATACRTRDPAPQPNGGSRHAASTLTSPTSPRGRAMGSHGPFSILPTSRRETTRGPVLWDRPPSGGRLRSYGSGNNGGSSGSSTLGV
jgi:hypothetical protein